MSWLASLKQFLGRRKRPNQPITVHEEGFFFVGNSGERAHVKWNEVVEVRALKLDLLCWDEVRFLFVLTSGTTIEISEAQPGFEATLSAAVLQFPSIASWNDRIMKPAFDRNETIFYQRLPIRAPQPQETQ